METIQINTLEINDGCLDDLTDELEKSYQEWYRLDYELNLLGDHYCELRHEYEDLRLDYQDLLDENQALATRLGDYETTVEERLTQEDEPDRRPGPTEVRIGFQRKLQKAANQW